MNAYWLQWYIMFPTDFWKKVRVFSLFSDFWHLLYSILAADFCVNQDSKDMQEVKQQKLLKTMEILTVFVNFWLNQIQNCSVQIKKMKGGIFT